MSATFSANKGSLLNLKVRNRCGFKPCFFQMRLTEASLMPVAWAMLRVLQCVASAGFSRVVRATISCVRWAEICGLRPGRGASFSILPSSSPIAESVRPLAAIRIILARCAARTVTVRPRARFSSSVVAQLRVLLRALLASSLPRCAMSYCFVNCDALH